MDTGKVFEPPCLVVITGPPGGGKTSLARELGSHLGLVVICKDDLKEILFATLGWGNRQRSRTLSDVAYELMFYIAGAQLEAGHSIILEANFREEWAQRIERLGVDRALRIVQIRCSARREVLFERLERRALLGTRHPGHLDYETAPEIPAWVDSAAALPLAGPLLEVDTTVPERIDPERVARRIRALISESDQR